jgi:hypothetical protein
MKVWIPRAALALSVIFGWANVAFATQVLCFLLKMGLAKNPDVQSDLKLTEGQLSSVRATIERAQSDVKSMQREFEQGVELTPATITKGEELDATIQRTLDTVLNNEQRSRFHQILLQQSGILALTHPEVQDQLSLADVQRDRIREIARDSAQGTRMILDDYKRDRDRPKAERRIAELRRREMDAGMANLTPEQRNKWIGMIGRPAEIRKLSLSAQSGLPVEVDAD